MKKLSAILMPCLLFLGCNSQTYNSPDGRVPEAYVSYVEPFLGTYQSEKGVVTVTLDHGFLRLTTNFDVSGENCGAKLGALRSVQVFDNTNGESGGPFDADFALDVGRCEWLPTRVATFHFNRTLTGAPIFELSVLVKEGEFGPRGEVLPEYQTWLLKKVAN